MQNNKEEIKKLIEMGFDLELLSFELDVPIEELKQYYIFKTRQYNYISKKH